jgi:hypothetical protein
MSRAWNPSIYRTHDAQSPPPDASRVESLIRAVDICSTRLQDEPYNPNIWLERAGIFLALNYPELAASDAHKASLLADQPSPLSERTDSEPVGTKVQDILSQALYDCHCHWELAEFWNGVAIKSPSEHVMAQTASINNLLAQKSSAAAPLGGTLQEKKDRLRDGGVITVNYPWLEERHFTRNGALIESVNEELSPDSEQQTCYLAPSTLPSTGDVLGMFAKRDIQRGERILLDRTATGACSNIEDTSCDNCFRHVKGLYIQASCCKAMYCSIECRQLAFANFHAILCDQDFSWLQEPAKGLIHNASPLRPLLMLRFLATCLQTGAHIHPLDHPSIARLQSLAGCSHVDVFTYTESITTPVRILQQLGVDVFANRNFDTMILHTVWTRIANNKAGSSDPRHGFIDEISPHLPLFNHSCEPNIEWRREDGSTTIRFFARRGIREDEELFSSYLDVGEMTLEERTEALWPWFEGPCLCSKCGREKVALSNNNSYVGRFPSM